MMLFLELIKEITLSLSCGEQTCLKTLMEAKFSKRLRCTPFLFLYRPKRQQLWWLSKLWVRQFKRAVKPSYSSDFCSKSPSRPL
jgi:hypothetical protein